MKKNILGALFCCLLSGCLGKDKVHLEGERVPIFSGEEKGVPSRLGGKIPSLPSPHSRLEWRQTERNARHVTGHLALGSGLVPVWSTDVGNTGEGKVLSGPVCVDGLVSFFDAQGGIQTLKLKDGIAQERIKVIPDAEDLLGGGVARGARYLIVASPDRTLTAVDPKTHKFIWRQTLAGPSRGAPTVSDGRVYVLNLHHQVEAFDEKTGDLLWSHSGLGKPVSLVGTSVPAVSKDIVIATFASGEVAALRASNGYVLWSEMISASRGVDAAESSINHIRAHPVIGGGRVYVISHSGRMVAFNLYNGSVIWKTDLGGSQTPVVLGDVIYQVTDTGQLVCLRKQDGRCFWKRQLSKIAPKVYDTSWSSPVVAGGHLYLAGSAGTLLALDAKEGTFVKSFSLGESMSLPPIVVDRTLICTTNNGNLRAFRAP